MRQWVKDVGKSEGYAVMAWIAVQTLPHLKRGKLPTGVSSRKKWTNDLGMGKQMTADFGLAGALMSSNAWLLPLIIVKFAWQHAGGSGDRPLRCLSLLR
jgi:hypothetical protein